jgi:hypothetical protein
MRPQDIQLNPKPQRRLSTWLLVEPLALRLIRLQEVPREDNCRFFPSKFSSDPLTGSNCFLRHRQYMLSVASLSCLLLGTSLIFIFQSTGCINFVVTVLSFKYNSPTVQKKTILMSWAAFVVWIGRVLCYFGACSWSFQLPYPSYCHPTNGHVLCGDIIGGYRQYLA